MSWRMDEVDQKSWEMGGYIIGWTRVKVVGSASIVQGWEQINIIY